VERNEDRLAALVHIYHGIQQGIDDEMRPLIDLVTQSPS
jgi:hypothetical protein